MTPNITFNLHKKFDMAMAEQFLFSDHPGVDSRAVILETHPELSHIEDGEGVEEYFNTFYKKHSSDLELAVHAIEDTWRIVEEQFFDAITRLFGELPFNSKEYAGFLSIYALSARLLDKNCFQVFYKYDNPNSTIAHEMLHFAFYPYTRKHHSELIEGLDADTGLWWDVAEIFNTVVLSDRIFQEIIATKEDEYDHHQKLLPTANVMYKRSTSIDNFIVGLFNLVALDPPGIG